MGVHWANSALVGDRPSRHAGPRRWSTHPEHGGTSVTVSLLGVADDGQAGEKDDGLNAEHVIGGNGNDTLVGKASPNTLRGLLGKTGCSASTETTPSSGARGPTSPPPESGGPPDQRQVDDAGRHQHQERGDPAQELAL
jgi:hypothetical protein